MSALALAGGIALSGLMVGDAFFAPTPAAHAMEPGPGAWAGGMGVGSFRHSDGTQVYCVELGINPVTGNTDSPLQEVGALPAYSATEFMSEGNWFYNITAPALSGEKLRQLNYILGRYGNTANNTQAAAVQLAVWKLRAAGASDSYQGLLASEIAFAERFAAGSSAQADAMINEAVANAAAGTPTTKPSLSSTGSYRGTVNATAGTQILTLTNAIWTETGTNTIDLKGQARSLNWEGVPPEGAGFDRYYRVTLDGTYRYSITGDRVFYAKDSQGVSSGGGPSVASGKFDAQYVDPDTIFSPVLTTQVPSEFVKKGEKFSDTVNIYASEAQDMWRWFNGADGEKRYAPIKATGVLYGPFLADPADNPSATPPKNSPVAGTAEFTTDVLKGPGAYPIDSSIVATESGYYTWVWEIDLKNQVEAIKNPPAGRSPLPDNYYFTDGFGVVTEGQIVPTNLKWTTELSKKSVALNASFTDDVTVTLNSGGWLQTDGKRTPFTLRGTMYASSKKPTQQATVPADAVELSSTKLVVNEEGKSTSKKYTVPLRTDAKYVTVQWCLFDEDQPAGSKGKAAEWCDDYGVPSETAKVDRPVVTTQAQENAGMFDTIKDTAIIKGTLPEGVKNEIDFTAYLKPEAGQPKYDTKWNVVLDADGNPVLWTEAEVSDPAAVCDVQPVATTKRVPVTKIGEVDSPGVVAKSDGTIYWVESLIVTPPGEEEFVMHKGKCGLPNETTIVEKPTVTTQAQEDGQVGGTITDTAIVEGRIPNVDRVKTEVDFTLFLKPEVGQPKYDEDWNVVLDEEGEIVLWTEEDVADPEAVCEAQPVAKTDRVEVTGEGEFVSPEVLAKSSGTTYWVETTVGTPNDPKDGEEFEIARGICGLPNETTVIEEPKVRTEAKSVVEGQEIFDTAFTSEHGDLSKIEGVEYRITFKAYERTEGKDMVCSTENEIKDFEDATGVVVAEEGKYESAKVKTTSKHVGLGGYQETLIREEGGKETVISVGKCGEASENFEVKPKPVPPVLADTGAAQISLMALGFIVVAAGAGSLAMVRRKGLKG